MAVDRRNKIKYDKKRKTKNIVSIIPTEDIQTDGSNSLLEAVSLEAVLVI